jgi:hypothetical protein
MTLYDLTQTRYKWQCLLFDACTRAASLAQRDGLGIVTFFLENTVKMIEQDALMMYSFTTPEHRGQLDQTQTADDNLVDAVYIYGQRAARWACGLQPCYTMWDYPADIPRTVTCETFGGQLYDRATGHIMYRVELFTGDEKLLAAT